jgi:dethiobiotin synthetase
MAPPRFFVTAIGTEIGKTAAASVLVEALRADYWKPIQCGELQASDTHTVQSRVSFPVHCHPERFRLQAPKSPHLAAAEEGVSIQLSDFSLPHTDNALIVEGAGGILVPLNESTFMLDLMKKLQLPVLIVTRNYLGSLNHTFLTVELLRQSGLPLAGLIFNGSRDAELESFVSNNTQLPILFRMESHPTLTPAIIKSYGDCLRGTF